MVPELPFGGRGELIPPDMVIGWCDTITAWRAQWSHRHNNVGLLSITTCHLQVMRGCVCVSFELMSVEQCVCEG